MSYKLVDQKDDFMRIAISRLFVTSNNNYIVYIHNSSMFDILEILVSSGNRFELVYKDGNILISQ